MSLIRIEQTLVPLINSGWEILCVSPQFVCFDSYKIMFDIAFQLFPFNSDLRNIKMSAISSSQKSFQLSKILDQTILSIPKSFHQDYENVRVTFRSILCWLTPYAWVKAAAMPLVCPHALHKKPQEENAYYTSLNFPYFDCMTNEIHV